MFQAEENAAECGAHNPSFECSISDVTSSSQTSQKQDLEEDTMLLQPTPNTEYCDVILTQPHDVTGVHSSYSDYASFLSQPLAPVMEEIEPDVITEIDTNDDSANYECESASGVFQQDKCLETRELTLMVTPGSLLKARQVIINLEPLIMQDGWEQFFAVKNVYVE